MHPDAVRQRRKPWKAPPGRPDLDSVVVGVDGSSTALTVASWAADEAHRRNVRLRLVLAVPSSHGTEHVIDDTSCPSPLVPTVTGRRAEDYAEVRAGAQSPSTPPEVSMVGDDRDASASRIPQPRLDALQAQITDARDTRDRLTGLLEAVTSLGQELDLAQVLRGIVEAAVVLVDAEYGALGGKGFDAQDEGVLSTLAVAAGVAVDNARLYEEVRLRERWLAASSDFTSALLSGSSEIEVLEGMLERARDIISAEMCVFYQVGPSGELRGSLALG